MEASVYPEVYRKANGRSQGHFEEEDFGPETDVDSVDDVLLSPSIAAAKALAARSPLPVEEVANDVVEGEAEESGEDSEEEWNYFRGEEKEAQSKTEEEDQSESDMESRLNPNAAEFVPSIPLEPVIASSPVKGAEISLEDVVIPSQKDFDNEISQRPSQLEPANDKKEEPPQNGSDDFELLSTKAEYGDESTYSISTSMNISTAFPPDNDGSSPKVETNPFLCDEFKENELPSDSTKPDFIKDHFGSPSEQFGSSNNMDEERKSISSPDIDLLEMKSEVVDNSQSHENIPQDVDSPYDFVFNGDKSDGASPIEAPLITSEFHLTNQEPTSSSGFDSESNEEIDLNIQEKPNDNVGITFGDGVDIDDIRKTKVETQPDKVGMKEEPEIDRPITPLENLISDVISKSEVLSPFVNVRSNEDQNLTPFEELSSPEESPRKHDEPEKVLEDLRVELKEAEENISHHVLHEELSSPVQLVHSSEIGDIETKQTVDFIQELQFNEAITQKNEVATSESELEASFEIISHESAKEFEMLDEPVTKESIKESLPVDEKALMDQNEMESDNSGACEVPVESGLVEEVGISKDAVFEVKSEILAGRANDNRLLDFGELAKNEEVQEFVQELEKSPLEENLGEVSKDVFSMNAENLEIGIVAKEETISEAETIPEAGATTPDLEPALGEEAILMEDDKPTIVLTPEAVHVPVSEQASTVVLTPEPDQTPVLALTPEPEQVPLVALTPEPEQVPILALTPEPEQVPILALTPEPEQAPILALTPEPEQAPILALTPEPGQAPILALTPEPEQAPIITLTPEPEQAPILALTPEPEQIPALALAPEPEQIPALALTPEPEQIPALALTPEPVTVPIPEPEVVSPRVLTPEPEQAQATVPTPEPEQAPVTVPTPEPEPAPVAEPTMIPQPPSVAEPLLEPKIMEEVKAEPEMLTPAEILPILDTKPEPLVAETVIVPEELSATTPPPTPSMTEEKKDDLMTEALVAAGVTAVVAGTAAVLASENVEKAEKVVDAEIKSVETEKPVEVKKSAAQKKPIGAKPAPSSAKPTAKSPTKPTTVGTTQAKKPTSVSMTKVGVKSTTGTGKPTTPTAMKPTTPTTMKPTTPTSAKPTTPTSGKPLTPIIKATAKPSTKPTTPVSKTASPASKTAAKPTTPTKPKVEVTSAKPSAKPSSGVSSTTTSKPKTSLTSASKPTSTAKPADKAPAKKDDPAPIKKPTTATTKTAPAATKAAAPAKPTSAAAPKPPVTLTAKAPASKVPPSTKTTSAPKPATTAKPMPISNKPPTATKAAMKPSATAKPPTSAPAKTAAKPPAAANKMTKPSAPNAVKKSVPNDKSVKDAANNKISSVKSVPKKVDPKASKDNQDIKKGANEMKETELVTQEQNVTTTNGHLDIIENGVQNGDSPIDKPLSDIIEAQLI